MNTGNDGETPTSVLSSSHESPALATVHDLSQRFDTSQGALSDAELEAAIVEAVMRGLDDVARTLAGRLETRRQRAAVVDLGSRRRR